MYLSNLKCYALKRYILVPIKYKVAVVSCFNYFFFLNFSFIFIIPHAH